MPCYDHRDDDARVRDSKHRKALTALLCGVLNNRPNERKFAELWLHHHNALDTHRKTGDPKHWKTEQKLVSTIDNVLDRAYEELCR